MCIRDSGAAHQVMGLETVVLLESDPPVTVLKYGGLYLPVGGADAQLAANAEMCIRDSG